MRYCKKYSEIEIAQLIDSKDIFFFESHLPNCPACKDYHKTILKTISLFDRKLSMSDIPETISESDQASPVVIKIMDKGLDLIKSMLNFEITLTPIPVYRGKNNERKLYKNITIFEAELYEISLMFNTVSSDVEITVVNKSSRETSLVIIKNGKKKSMISKLVSHSEVISNGEYKVLVFDKVISFILD